MTIKQMQINTQTHTNKRERERERERERNTKQNGWISKTRRTVSVGKRVKIAS
jgi:hypothetical protein